MMRLPLVSTLTACALVAAIAPSLLAQDVPHSSKLLPPNVFLYGSAPNVTELRSRADLSSFGEMLKDPKLEPAREQIRAKIQENAGKVEEQLGISLKELIEIPTGEVAFAVFQVPGESVGLMALVEYGANEENVNKLLAKAEASLVERGATRSEAEFEGTPILVFEGAAPAEDAASDDEIDLDIEGESEGASGDGKPFTGKVAWFRKDGRLVLGNSAAVLEVILARWDGSHQQTLAGQDVYSYIVEQTRSDDRDAAVQWFIDPMGGLQTFLANAENLPPQAQMVGGVLPLLGLTSLKGVGGGFDLATNEFNSVGKTFLYIEAPPGGDLGLLTIFQLVPGELTPPAWVTEDVTTYVGARWDSVAAIDAVKRLMDTFQGPGAFDNLMEKAARVDGGPSIHPKRDLIDRLTGEIHLVNYPAPAPEAGADSKQQPQPTVIALGVQDEGAIKDILAKLAGTPNFPGKAREFEGATLYELPTNAAGQASTAVLTTANGNLLFATDVPHMEQILRDASGTPLAETDNFQKIAKYFPAETLMISYQDQQDQVKTVYEMFRSGAVGEQIEGFDPSVLPPFEDVAKYMREGGGYAISDERGALFVNFTLNEE